MIGLICMVLLCVVSSLIETYSTDWRYALFGTCTKLSTGLAILSLNLINIISRYFEVIKKLKYSPITLLRASSITLVVTVMMFFLGSYYTVTIDKSLEFVFSFQYGLFAFVFFSCSILILSMLGHIVNVLDKVNSRIEINLKSK